MTSGGAHPESWLVADVRATNARFGLVLPGKTVLQTRTLAVATQPDDRRTITTYLAERGAFPMPRQGALAIASVITGDRVTMTNHPWSFSISGRSLGATD